MSVPVKTTASPMQSPSVVAIVVAWNSADCIARCLASLEASQFKVKTIVIDNDSHDETAAVVGQFPDVTYHNTQANLGYAGGNNVGIKQAMAAGADYVFILNPDAYVATDCIGTMVAAMEADQTIAAASPKIYYADSDTVWFAGATLDWRNGTSAHIGQGMQDTGQFDQDIDLSRANGCAMLVRTSALPAVGLLDEQYFLYYEETDWSVRFTNAGYTLRYIAAAHCYHAASQSTGGYFAPLYQYYTTRNSLLFMRTHHADGWPLFVMRHLGLSVQKLYRTARNRPRNVLRVARAIGKGYGDYARGRFGRQPI
jgi:GT2 family glycosyltransferase